MDEEEEELSKVYGEPAFYNNWRMYSMNNHDLMMRLEERTRNIWHLLEKMERHQEEQNGFIKQALERSISNKTWIAVLRIVGGAAILAIFSVIGWLIKVLGIW